MPTPLSRSGVQRNPGLRAMDPRKERRRSSLRRRSGSGPGEVRFCGNRKEAGAGLRFDIWLSGDRQSSLCRRPGKGPIEACFGGSPWEPGRSFGFGREPEREPTGAERPRPEPDPRRDAKLRQKRCDRGQWGPAAMPAPIRVWSPAQPRPSGRAARFRASLAELHHLRPVPRLRPPHRASPLPGMKKAPPGDGRRSFRLRSAESVSSCYRRRLRSRWWTRRPGRRRGRCCRRTARSWRSGL